MHSRIMSAVTGDRTSSSRLGSCRHLGTSEAGCRRSGRAAEPSISPLFVGVVRSDSHALAVPEQSDAGGVCRGEAVEGEEKDRLGLCCLTTSFADKGKGDQPAPQVKA